MEATFLNFSGTWVVKRQTLLRSIRNIKSMEIYYHPRPEGIRYIQEEVVSQAINMIIYIIANNGGDNILYVTSIKNNYSLAENRIILKQ